MFKSIKAFFATFTGSQFDGFVRAAPALSVIAGVSLVLAGNIWVGPPTGLALSTIGVTVLGSGVFAAMLKYFQFIGVFKDEFQEILKSPNMRSFLLEHHLSLKKQGSDVYEHVTARKIAEIYPELQDAFDSSRGDYSDGEFDFYVDGFERTIVLKAFEQATGMVEIEDETALDLVAPSKEKIKYSFRIRPDAKTLPDGFRVISLIVDNQNMMSKLQADKDLVAFDHELQGKQRYKVKRKVTQRYHLRFDSIKTHTFDRLTKEPTVRIRNEVESLLDFEFVKLNSKRDWKKEVATENRVSEHSYFFPDLLFPHQGYYITLSERSHPVAAGAAQV